MSKKAHDRLIRVALGAGLIVFFCTAIWMDKLPEGWGPKWALTAIVFASGILLGWEIFDFIQSWLNGDGGDCEHEE